MWKKRTRQMALIALLATIILVLIRVGYASEWAGFSAVGDPKTQQYQPAKTLWDWMQLLIIPAVLAAAAFWFNAQQSKTDREINAQQREQELKLAEDREQATVLETYLDRMTELLLDKHLRESKPEDEIRKVARARTLTALRRLNPARKTALIGFLYEADLIGNGPFIISLHQSDLSGTHFE